MASLPLIQIRSKPLPHLRWLFLSKGIDWYHRRGCTGGEGHDGGGCSSAGAAAQILDAMRGPTFVGLLLARSLLTSFSPPSSSRSWRPPPRALRRQQPARRNATPLQFGYINSDTVFWPPPSPCSS
ncbi:unnamed protein product [Urochloa humidicola]